MEAPPNDLLAEIVTELLECQRWQSDGMDVVSSACWDNALNKINTWVYESCASFVVTGLTGTRRERWCHMIEKQLVRVGGEWHAVVKLDGKVAAAATFATQEPAVEWVRIAAEEVCKAAARRQGVAQSPTLPQQ